MKPTSCDPLKLYYSIGEVSKIVGVEPPTLRYWEKEFPQFQPKRSSKGRRQYTTDDIEIARQIYHRVRIEGISIEKAKDLIGQIPDAEGAKIEAVARLIKIRHTLNTLKDRL